MITITEVQEVLKRNGHNITRQAVKNWILINRIDAQMLFDNSLVYDLDDVLPYIQKRVKLSKEQIEQELKEIRTILIN